MIEHDALREACKNADKKLVEIMIKNGANDWDTIFTYFKRDLKFLMRILRRIRKDDRKAFVYQMGKYLEYNENFNSEIDAYHYLINRHFIKITSIFCPPFRKYDLRQIAQEFVCYFCYLLL